VTADCQKAIKEALLAGGYSLSLPANTAASHLRPLLRASELRGGCFRRLTLSCKTGTPEENFWNVYCFATIQVRDETAKENRQTTAWSSHDVTT